MGRAAERRSTGQVDQAMSGALVEVGAEQLDEFGQRFRVRGREREHDGAVVAAAYLPRRFFEDHVRAGAADVECADAGAQRRTGFPVARLGGDDERAVLELELGIDLRLVDGRDEGAVLQHQHGLDQAGHARGAVEVADVGLDRADRAETGLVGVLTQYGFQGFELARVRSGGAGRVRLDVAEGFGRYAGLLQGAFDEIGLVVLVADRGSADHRVDGVAVGHSLVEALQEHGRDAVAADRAVGGRVEYADVAGRRQDRLGTRVITRCLRHVYCGCAGKGEVRIAGPQRLAGKVNRDQGGRPSSLYADRRAGEAESVGDACRQEVRRLVLLGVEVHAGAGEDADPAGRSRVTAVFERVLADLEEDPLRRVGQLGLAIAQPEELGIERLHVIQRTAHRDELIVAEGILRALDLVRGEPSDALDTGRQVVPELLQRVRTREPRGEPDDRDRLNRLLLRALVSRRCCLLTRMRSRRTPELPGALLQEVAQSKNRLLLEHHRPRKLQPQHFLQPGMHPNHRDRVDPKLIQPSPLINVVPQHPPEDPHNPPNPLPCYFSRRSLATAPGRLPGRNHPGHLPHRDLSRHGLDGLTLRRNLNGRGPDGCGPGRVTVNYRISTYRSRNLCRRDLGGHGLDRVTLSISTCCNLSRHRVSLATVPGGLPGRNHRGRLTHRTLSRHGLCSRSPTLLTGTQRCHNLSRHGLTGRGLMSLGLRIVPATSSLATCNRPASPTSTHHRRLLSRLNQLDSISRLTFTGRLGGAGQLACVRGLGIVCRFDSIGRLGGVAGLSCLSGLSSNCRYDSIRRLGGVAGLSCLSGLSSNCRYDSIRRLGIVAGLSCLSGLSSNCRYDSIRRLGGVAGLSCLSGLSSNCRYDSIRRLDGVSRLGNVDGLGGSGGVGGFGGFGGFGRLRLLGRSRRLDARSAFRGGASVSAFFALSSGGQLARFLGRPTSSRVDGLAASADPSTSAASASATDSSAAPAAMDSAGATASEASATPAASTPDSAAGASGTSAPAGSASSAPAESASSATSATAAGSLASSASMSSADSARSPTAMPSAGSTGSPTFVDRPALAATSDLGDSVTSAPADSVQR